MSLHATIKNQIKEALLARDAVRLSVLRGLQASFMNELIAKKSLETELSDENVLTIIKRAVNQRKDSIEQFEKGGRNDLADSEKKELEILLMYLPKMMEQKEILKIALEIKDKSGIKNKSEAGKLTGLIMKELKGKADGADVKIAVDSLLA